MSLPRKEIRFYVYQETYEDLEAIALGDGQSLAAVVEAMVAPAARKRVHRATVIADKRRATGGARSNTESTPADESDEPGNER